MKEFNKGDIINEEGEIVNFKKLKNITNSGIEKCVCKIIQIVEINREQKIKAGTGFFCVIQEKKIKVLITNNHIIDEKFLENEKKLSYEVEEKEKEINLELSRYKMTNKELDFTIIEKIKEDNVNNFLEIDKYINTYDYINEQIFTAQYPAGDELNYSHGKIIDKKNGYFVYSVGTKGGASGSPIILFNKLKVIGLHIGYLPDNKSEKIKIGIPLNLIIQKINKNKIKCIYYYYKYDTYIQIINDSDWCGGNKNKEIQNNVEIIISGKKEANILKYYPKKKGFMK